MRFNMKIFNFLKRKKKSRKPNLAELVAGYNFYNHHQTDYLNHIFRVEFGKEYDLPVVSIEQQIRGLKSHLYIQQKLALEREDYLRMAKLRDDIYKTDILLQKIYKVT